MDRNRVEGEGQEKEPAMISGSRGEKRRRYEESRYEEGEEGERNRTRGHEKKHGERRKVKLN